ncbi:MAG: flagellar biosynthetic protein FliR [Phycisphaerae bacterium]
MESAILYMSSFVLAFFRVGAMFMFAPLFGSGNIPRRIKLLFASVVALAMVPAVPPTVMPPNIWYLTAGIGMELLFGLAMGTVVSLVFIGVQWAGQMISQQMGFHMSEVMDPQFSSGASPIGDVLFIFTLFIFLIVGGHRELLRGVHASFAVMPPLEVVVDARLLELLLDMTVTMTLMALRLAAPMFVTMLVVDVALGCISKTMPQMNVLAAGLSLRSGVGLLVLIFGLVVTGDVIAEYIGRATDVMLYEYQTPRGQEVVRG